MSWEYRVMVCSEEFAIYEVYYHEDGSIKGYGAAPVFPAGETFEELKANFDLYVAALAKPVLKHGE